MAVSPAIIEALRITLQQLEHSPDPDFDSDAVAQLKHILLRRIGQLEAQHALSGNGTSAAITEAPASVPSMTTSFTLAELQTLQEATEHVKPGKLD